MKGGELEPKKDAETLMGIYKKFDLNGHQKESLTVNEQILIFALAEYLEKMGDDKS